MSFESVKLESTAPRRYSRVAAFAVLGTVVGALGMLVVEPILRPSLPQPAAVTVATSTGPYALERAFPIELRIPKLSIETEFEAPLELAPDNSIEIPETYTKVGWYKLGAAPGELGTATVLGHVDSFEGPAVFYDIGKLEKGDRIYIERDDGSEAEFEVEMSEEYSQDAFPTEKVYTHTPYPSLRLVTCTGTYDHATKRYSHNLVVYAKLVEPEA